MEAERCHGGSKGRWLRLVKDKCAATQASDRPNGINAGEEATT